MRERVEEMMRAAEAVPSTKFTPPSTHLLFLSQLTLLPVRDGYSFPAAFSSCSLLSYRSLSGWKRWSSRIVVWWGKHPSKPDEITISLSNGLPLHSSLANDVLSSRISYYTSAQD
ncbi:extra-large GTP-binding protein 3 [Striga asiatica]|uniref:Extra-large GTP-binding protein 3 n=1 Tax=Striga asiatica TaxID=4170 RepID=A0A5A7P4B6_STRAF|nr:extra-large GTP-binding protein 3 [Striga asiatica]